MPLVLPLVALDVLVVVLWTIAVALAIALLMRKLGSVLNAIPVVGGYIAGAVEAMAQVISNAAGSLEHGLDKLAGAAWHLLARYMDSLWHGFASNAATLLHFAQLLLRLTHATALLHSLVHHVSHAIDAGNARTEAELKKFARGIDRINSRIKAIDHRIDDVIMPRVKAAEREINHLGDVVIPDIRGLVNGALGDIGALKKWITDHVPLIGTTAFAGAVAWALGSIGLGGLRCNSLLNSLNKRGCGLWSGLEDVLGLLIDVTVFTNACAIMDFLSPLVSDVAAPIVTALTDVGAGLCKGTIGPPDALTVPALYLPANPGDTLHLP